jgi:hypothetical protein
MPRILLAAAFIFCVGFTLSANAQDVGQRTQNLVAALDKTKYKKKEKKNISIEVYVDVKNEAVVRQDPSEYSGVYKSEGYSLDLRVAKDGSATGSGTDGINENAKQAAFTLRDGRVQGALLTGTKVYENGETQAFEAVFANRTVTNGRNPENINGRETSFGLGFIQNAGTWTNRVFLEKN